RTQESTAIVVGLVVVVLVVRRLRVLGGPARRAQGPLLVAAAVTATSAVICLGWVLATDSDSSALETIVRAIAISMPLGIVAGSCGRSCGGPSCPSSSSSCRRRREACASASRRRS